MDTNILLDFLNPSEPHHEESVSALLDAGSLGSLVIGEATYAELAASFESIDEIERFLDTTGIELERSDPGALVAAGAAWLYYTRRRPDGLECPQCGNRQIVICVACRTNLRPRQHLLADFLIGAHAMLHTDQLLTRDRGYYRTYFPELRLA